MINNPSKKSSKLRFAIIITGILSGIIVLAIVYGHYAGNAFISMTREAQKKGIELSETPDFENGSSMLKITTIDNFQDILESLHCLFGQMVIIQLLKC